MDGEGGLCRRTINGSLIAVIYLEFLTSLMYRSNDRVIAHDLDTCWSHSQALAWADAQSLKTFSTQ